MAVIAKEVRTPAGGRRCGASALAGTPPWVAPSLPAFPLPPVPRALDGWPVGFPEPTVFGRFRGGAAHAHFSGCGSVIYQRPEAGTSSPFWAPGLCPHCPTPVLHQSYLPTLHPAPPRTPDGHAFPHSVNRLNTHHSQCYFENKSDHVMQPPKISPVASHRLRLMSE